MDDEAEKAIKKSNTLKALRDVAEKKQDLQDKMKQSVHKPTELLESVFERLQYTSQPVCITGSASEEEISKITQAVLDLDPNIDVNTLQKCHLKNYAKLSEFIDNHCVLRL
ncbi:hypothetical protein SNE40_013019 [Patella caerulea]|uniref:Uncharacterized protein n=1 Tax=Patella caerulea TaxID=87958 RepID=A0AAN8JM48_PATCE